MKRLMKLIMSFFLLLSIVTCSLAERAQNATTPATTPEPRSCLSGVNDAHRQQWAENGSSSYVIKSSEDDLAITQGTYLITVNDKKITSVEVIESWMKYVSPADFPKFKRLTIEGMFNSIDECAKGYQVSTCSCTYDPKYGYPTNVEMIGLCTDCSSSYKATLMSLLPSPTKEP